MAGLLKQFFRELPEPVLTVDLHSAFLKAQELPAEEERTSATVLLSCVLPDRNLNALRYFFSFLQSVSQRYDAEQCFCVVSRMALLCLNTCKVCVCVLLIVCVYCSFLSDVLRIRWTAVISRSSLHPISFTVETAGTN